MKYEPKYNKSRSWEEIENWYIDLIEHELKFEPMLNLIRHIRNSNLHERLYGYTSVHKLVIGIYEDIEWDREALHIEFDTVKRLWFFQYRAKPFRPIEFDKCYNEELGIEKLDSFINGIKW